MHDNGVDDFFQSVWEQISPKKFRVAESKNREKSEWGGGGSILGTSIDSRRSLDAAGRRER